MRASIEDALQSGESVEQLKESLSDCAEDIGQIVTMLNALMDISEAETGTMKLNPETIGLASLVDEVVVVYRCVAEEKGVGIETSVPENILLNVDRTRFRQALANLLANSIKYTSQGYVRIDARREGGHVAISFEDTGDGIAPEDISRIFDRLYRGDRSRSQRGLGLGLSFVKAVLAAHNGRIEVQSTLNQGSTFTIYLPAPQTDQ